MKRFFKNSQLQTGRGFLLLIGGCFLFILSPGCKEEKKEDHSQHQQAVVKELYTCPMPGDSVFSDKPGRCPKCGMELVKKERKAVQEITLNALLKPTNEFVIASLSLVTPEYREEPVEISALGYTTYNTSSVGTIAARTSGRIEKLYVKYRYQRISKGQRIMDIYSPELVTAQQNLLFLLKNDKENTAMIESAKQRLLLMGLAEKQVQEVIRSGRPSMSVAVYSYYSGHIHEAGETGTMKKGLLEENEIMDASQTTRELNLKEGMYLQKGQAVFSVYDPSRLWILLNIYPQDQFFVKKGDDVLIIPETRPGPGFRASIHTVEPFFRKGSRTITARVNYDNRELQLPIGSQVKAVIFSGEHKGWWLPDEAVLSLGQDKIVFLKTREGFRVHKIQTGHAHKKMIQVTAGLSEKDAVATNARYLIDSESFVKLNDE